MNIEHSSTLHIDSCLAITIMVVIRRSIKKHFYTIASRSNEFFPESEAMNIRLLSSYCFIIVPILFSVIICTTTSSLATEGDAQKFSRISVDEYRDKMAAGWIGQMAGVGWGAPTEFRFNGRIIPKNKVPRWKPELINQFKQDDIYVEMTFLATLERYGFDVSIRQAGADFGNSRYQLWHANKAGRDNIRKGIAPPDSGHPKFNNHADDIDYQIEADYAGLISPGMPNLGIELGEKFGRLMNYGDGVYGGQFVSGMYAEAFFETDPRKIVEAGLKCVPADSQYAEAIRDVLAWHADNPDDWQATWKKIDEKYHINPNYRRFSCSRLKETPFNIDAKINGAYIVMGLLYGGGDLDKTIVVSMRCGQDSDCNPSNAAGVLATSIGRKNLPRRFTSALDAGPKFSHTSYNFPGLLAVCEKLTRKAVERAGGRIESGPDGRETFVIPVETPRPPKLEQCWSPGPPAGSVYNAAERAKIINTEQLFQKNFERFVKGWKISHCGQDMSPGLKESCRGKKHVFVTHPADRKTACKIARKVSIKPGVKTELRLMVGHHPHGDWDLLIKADGKTLLQKTIGREVSKNTWVEARVDLTPLAGKSIDLELLNQPNGWASEAGYWDTIEIVEK